jgi:hypothetical protein
VPQRTTYYTDAELKALEAQADQQDESFSGVVREAIQHYWGIDE